MWISVIGKFRSVVFKFVRDGVGSVVLGVGRDVVSVVFERFTEYDKYRRSRTRM